MNYRFKRVIHILGGWKYMRKTKIVCTIGPASESIEKLTQLMEA